MTSPFPGMDPYLEDPEIWPDAHASLAVEISAHLNAILPPSYERLGEYPEIDETEDMFADAIRHHFVRICDASRNHHLVTLIDILSPSNKRSGKDRLAYRRKQTEILDSDANLIEIDLLRAGERVPAALEVEMLLDNMQPPADYLVVVNRAWNRLKFQLFPATLREWLPCFPVPLKEGEPEVLLDLQFVFNRAYDTGPYRRGAIDYSTTPRPPLIGEDAVWAAERVAESAR